MDTYQQIAELTAELRSAHLTAAERKAAIRQLHDLQHDIELDEVVAIDNGDSMAADTLYEQWTQIEIALAA